MKWDKYTIETTTEAEDYISSTLADLGIEGIEIEDKGANTNWQNEIFRTAFSHNHNLSIS